MVSVTLCTFSPQLQTLVSSCTEVTTVSDTDEAKLLPCCPTPNLSHPEGIRYCCLLSLPLLSTSPSSDPQVRLKRFLEMRGADGGPWRMICALPALWVGLIYEPQAQAEALQLISSWTQEDRDYLRTGGTGGGL